MKTFIEEMESIKAEHDAKIKKLHMDIRRWWIFLCVLVVVGNAPIFWAIYKQYKP